MFGICPFSIIPYDASYNLFFIMYYKKKIEMTFFMKLYRNCSIKLRVEPVWHSRASSVEACHLWRYSQELNALVHQFSLSCLHVNYKLVHAYIKPIWFEKRKLIYPHSLPTALQEPFCSHVHRSPQWSACANLIYFTSVSQKNSRSETLKGLLSVAWLLHIVSM